MDSLRLIPKHQPKFIKKTYTQGPSTTSTGIFNTLHTFKINRYTSNLIKQQFIKVTMNYTVFAGPQSTSSQPFGSNVIKRFLLRNQDNSIISEVTNHSFENWFASLEDSALQRKIEAGLVNISDVAGDWIAEITIAIPWFFSLRGELFDVSKGNFTVEILTGKDNLDMGLASDIIINGLSFQLLTIYEVAKTLEFPKLKNGTGVYEQSVDLEAGLTEKQILLRCDKRIFNVSASIKSRSGANATDVEITRVLFDRANGELFDFDKYNNYSINEDNNNDYTTCFNIPFGSRNGDFDNYDYITFDEYENLTLTTFYFGALPVDCVLTITMEYRTYADYDPVFTMKSE